jgi:hypothetical protein
MNTPLINVQSKNFARFMKKLILFFTFSLSLFIFSCNNDTNEGIDDTVLKEELIEADSTGTPEMMPEVADEITKGVDKDFVQNKKKIELTFGKQWDFCKCVVANDSLDKIIKSGVDLDDSFMTRFDLVEKKCKAFLVMNSLKTPAERGMHEKKVRDCLKANM